MKSIWITAAIVMAVAPAASAQAQASKDAKAKQPVTLQGCIVAGQDKGTFAMTGVQEIAAAYAVTVPSEAHGRRVVFWLDRQKEIATHAGHKVEVKGRVTEVIEGEIELKAGSKNDGALMVEFEGPGKDVRIPNSVIGAEIGTSGRVAAEKNDIKTFLMKVAVETIRPIDGACHQ